MSAIFRPERKNTDHVCGWDRNRRVLGLFLGVRVDESGALVTLGVVVIHNNDVIQRRKSAVQTR